MSSIFAYTLNTMITAYFNGAECIMIEVMLFL